MALNIPITKMDELLVQEVMERVPEHVKFLACALHWAPEVWRNEKAIRELMELRAHKAAYIDTVVNMIKTQHFFIGQHLQGKMEVVPAAAGPQVQLQRSYFETQDGLQLTPEQKCVEDNINQRVDQALRIRDETDDRELERLQALAEEHGSPVAVLGAPGTGKTAVLDQCIRRAQNKGARVLLAMPTGVQRPDEAAALSSRPRYLSRGFAAPQAIGGGHGGDDVLRPHCHGRSPPAVRGTFQPFG